MNTAYTTSQLAVREGGAAILAVPVLPCFAIYAEHTWVGQHEMKKGLRRPTVSCLVR